jgi:outer membrane protein assembly factor BamB
MFCYDFDGELVWKKTDFGKMRTRNGYGEGSSATIYGDTIVVPWDHEGPSYVIALNKDNGETIWKVDRDEPTCWATPLVIDRGGVPQVVVSGENFVRGYDLATGRELWRCGGQTTRPVASPVVGHGLVFVGSGFRGSFMGAFRLDRRGDLEGTDGVAWTITRDTPDVPSLLLSGRRLYFYAGRSGILSCVDAVTKKPFFSSERVAGIRDVYASPVWANGKIYLTSRDGTIVVIEDADELKIVATNHLNEGTDATPAIAGREIFVRGSSHLYCFAAP